MPKSELISRLRLIRPSASVTGSISFSTRITCGLRQSQAEAEVPAATAQPRQRQQELHDRARQDADRVGVDLVAVGQHRHEADERRDDHQVPGDGRERGHREVLERVQHPDHQPRQGEQHDDREHQLRRASPSGARSSGWSSKPGANSDISGPAKITNSAVTAPSTSMIRKNRRRGDPEGLLALALLQQLGEDRHEGALQRRVGEQGAHQVRHLEGDRERRHRPGDAEVAAPPRPRAPGPGRARDPVANEKNAVLRASRPACARRSVGSSSGALGRSRASVVMRALHWHPAALGRRGAASLRLWPTSHPKKSASSGRSASGSRIAAARPRSRPGSAGSKPPSPRATPRRPTTELAALISRIDKAVKSGALHSNNGARKKSRAMRTRARLG